MAPRRPQHRKRTRGGGQNPSSSASAQGVAPATPGYLAPTISSTAHQGGPVTGYDVEMSESTPHAGPATGDQDQEMADIPPVPQATVPAPAALAPAAPVAAQVAAPAAPAAAGQSQTLDAGSLLQNLPAVQLSRAEMTRLKMERIRARAEVVLKRPRTESAGDDADSEPSAAKKQQTQKPDDQQAVQEHAVMRRPFPYTEVTNTRRTFCCLRLSGGPIIGSFQRQNGWGIKFSMDAGTYGVHAINIELLCNIVDKSTLLKDVNSVPGDVNVIPMAWYTGARIEVDSNEGPYQLEDFEIFCIQDHPGHQAANERSVWEACPESKRRQLVYCRFKSNTTYYTNTVSGGEAWSDGINPDLLIILQQLMNERGIYVEIWFQQPFGSSSSFEEKVLMPFRRAYEERLPILSQYDVLDLDGTPSIKDIGQGMYCKYPMRSVPGSKNKVADQSGGPIGFSQLPSPDVYNFRRQFEIYHALIPIRESQYQKGLAIHVEMNAVRVYLMSLTGIEIKDRAQFQQMTPAQQRVHKTFYAFIRMPGKKGQKELAPTPGVRVQLEWDNSEPLRQKAHAPVKNSYRWKGVVIPHQGATVTATGTDYCVLLTMPNIVSRVPFQPFTEPKYLPNKELPLAHLKVNYSNSTYDRELEAWTAFCKSGRPQITAIHDVLRSNTFLENEMSRPNMAGGPTSTEENEQRYKELVDRFERDNILDRSQIHALRKAASVPNYARILQGPPGTGKTRTAVHLAWALVNAGHTVLFVAPTNVAVDSATTALVRSRPADMAHHMVIRAETNSLSMGEITKYVDYEEMEQDQPGIAKPLPVAEEDPIMAAFVEEFDASLDLQADVDFERYLATTQNFEKAYELALKAYNARAQDYPVEASMDFNVWRTCKEDDDRAAQRARDAQLETPHSITEPIASGKTESSDYAEAVKNWISFQGSPGSAAAKAFMKLRVQQEARSISKASIICTTASNSGADILAAKFKPTVIIMDEVGQMTAPAVAVPLMAYKTSMGTYFIGDPKQLAPLITALRLCEVRGIVEKSVLGTFIDRGYPLVFLEIQYRMDPEIASFPSQMFYDNKLKNAVTTMLDNEYKQAIRRVTSKYYGIKGIKGDGSLYMMVDVIHGRGRLEEGGTSLQNYANADAIVQAIKHLIAEGFPRSEIKLLSLYKGQKTVLVSKLVAGIEGNHWVPEDVTTVDSYQGKQGVFACLDMVAASNIEEGQVPASLMDEDAATAAAATGRFTVESVSSYVTNPHRLCVGITRTTCGLFVFCQTARLAWGYKASKSDYYNSVFRMVEDAQRRGLIHRDTVHYDTHPTALREVANLDAYHARARLARQDEQQWSFVESVVRKAQTQKQQREQKLSAVRKIPEPGPTVPAPSRRAPHVLPARPGTASLVPEPTTATPTTDEGGVSVTTRPATQRDQKKGKKSLRDRAVAAQRAEEGRTEKKKPEVIPRNQLEKSSWADIMDEEAAEKAAKAAEDGGVFEEDDEEDDVIEEDEATREPTE